VKRKYTKEVSIVIWIIGNFSFATSNDILAVLNVLFGAVYYVVMAYTGGSPAEPA
jgi:hypothetical protein